ncbi:hypothetical protein [Frankia sp. Cr1]|uniref:hypothetical protein n=1 Tax=Frankia sp. Cr1 TaxID=3073931 RepID=UPI002AD2F8C9|nr:hypothetical protein [Frankia sp. Cr1]
MSAGSAADQSDTVAIGVGEHGDAAVGRLDRVQDANAAELPGGAGEGTVYVLDREVGDQPDIRAGRAGLADPPVGWPPSSPISA